MSTYLPKRAGLNVIENATLKFCNPENKKSSKSEALQSSKNAGENIL